MNERQLRHEFETLQHERVQLSAELRAETSAQFVERRDAADLELRTLETERVELEAEIMRLSDREGPLTEARFEAERRWDRRVGWPAVGLSLGVLAMLLAWLSRHPRAQLAVAPFSAFALGLLVGPRLVVAWRSRRTDWRALRLGFSRTITGLVGFGSAVTVLLVLALAPSFWLAGALIPGALPSTFTLVVTTSLITAFVMTRWHLRRDPAAGDWGTVTVILALLGVAFGVLHLPDFASAWGDGHDRGAVTSVFSLFVPLTGLFRTRRAPHAWAHAIALGSALLCAGWTSMALWSGPAGGPLCFSAAACAMLGFVLSRDVEDPVASREAQLINAVALLGALVAVASGVVASSS